MIPIQMSLIHRPPRKYRLKFVTQLFVSLALGNQDLGTLNAIYTLNQSYFRVEQHYSLLPADRLCPPWSVSVPALILKGVRQAIMDRGRRVSEQGALPGFW